MKLEVITLKFSDEEGSFDNARLQEVLQGKEVVTFKEYKFERQGKHYWNILIHWKSASQANESPKHYKEILVEPDKPLFELLRKWRKAKSEEIDAPAFVIMSNIDLAYIAHRRPRSLAALKSIPGIGDKKAQNYGHEILQKIEKFLKSSQQAEEQK